MPQILKGSLSSELDKIWAQIRRGVFDSESFFIRSEIGIHLFTYLYAQAPFKGDFLNKKIYGNGCKDLYDHFMKI